MTSTNERNLAFADGVLEIESKGLDFSNDHYVEIVPYTKTKSEHGDARGESITVQVRMNPDIKRLIDEFVQMGRQEGIPYKTSSDFIRDAIYKWLRKCWMSFYPNNYEKRKLFAKEDAFLKRALDIEHRAIMRKTLHTFFEAVNVYLKEQTKNGLQQLCKELRWWVGEIEGIRTSDPYYHELYAREMIRHPSIKRVHDFLLKTDERDKTYVTILDAWRDEFQTEPERVVI